MSKIQLFQSFLAPGKAPFFRCQIFYSSTLSLHAPTLHFACAWPISCSILERKHSRKSLLEIIAPADQNHKTLGNAMSKECLMLVRRICRYAVHLHTMRPIEIDLKLPAVNSSNTTVLNNLEQKSVRAYVCSSPTPRRLGMLLMMQMGLRIGEVCGLQWGDFDLQTVFSLFGALSREFIWHPEKPP